MSIKLTHRSGVFLSILYLSYSVLFTLQTTLRNLQNPLSTTACFNSIRFSDILHKYLVNQLLGEDSFLKSQTILSYSTNSSFYGSRKFIIVFQKTRHFSRIMRHMDSVQTLESHLFTIHFVITHCD